MSNDELAIRVSNLSKCYKIFNQPHDRLKHSIYPRLQKLAGLQVKQYFREFWALRDVSFEVKKGETVGIVGRNGSGKSTLLQMICGTLAPTSGEVATYGRIAALLELGSGFNPEFTGRENVFINGAILGLSQGEIEFRFDDIAAFADIGQFIDQPVKTFSSGMLMRLAFAVQAIVEPDILIVDEALAVGDEKFQRKCFVRLEKLKTSGTSIILVSHSAPQVCELCDRAILLDRGANLMCANPLQVIRAYQRLIYAPRDEQALIVKQLQTAQSNRSIDELLEERSPRNNISETAFHSFDPGLVPETTIKYPVLGAEIETIQILDTGGHVVNVLQPGCDYQFVVSGRFLSAVGGVWFGLHIRSISGLEVTGQRYPENGKYVESLKAGKKFRVVFNFKMILLPGIYFVGGGVWSSGEPSCCHRVLDMLMFRLSPVKKLNSFGYVDAASKEPCLEII